nr:Maf family protein [Paramuribaculum sp.]
VISGVAVTVAGRQESFTATTEVTFSELLPEEIDYYISKFHPFDKAGAYGIQEWIGGIGVEKINGSFYNVMGLPIQRLYSLLKTF